MKVKITDLKKNVINALKNNYSLDNARKIADVVLYGEISGKKSHGINRLVLGDKECILAKRPTNPPQIIVKSQVSKIINGQQNAGILVASLAMNESISIAEQNAFSLVGTNNTFSGCGAVSYYLENIASKDLISIILPSSPAVIPPYNSYEPLFGTNPLGFGFPTNKKPFVLDMSSSYISYGELLNRLNAEEKLPENTVYDSKGNFTTDPKKGKDGAILSFDKSYKGANLALIVEILGGILVGSSFLDKDLEKGWGTLFLTFSPELLSDLDTFKKQMDTLTQRVKSSKALPDKTVRLPGEKTQETYQKNIEKGEIEVDDNIYQKILAYC